MKQHLFIAFLFLSACSDRKKSVQTITDTDETRQSPQHIASNPPVHIKSDIFEIANIDYLENKIQRIFVIISPQNVNDTTIIKQVVLALKASYPLNNKSNISFFSEKKYANYKTTLFTDEQHLLPKTAYQNWKDNYYLGEYTFKTMQYQTFPASSKWERQKTYAISHL